MLLTQLMAIGVIGLLLCAAKASPQEKTAQALNYDVIVHNRSIGRLNVVKAPTSSGIHYQVNADVAVWLMGEKHMVTRFTSTYRSNQLVEASFHDQLNGRTRHDSRVSWEGSEYHVQVNSKASVVGGRPATYSTASLYDREPVGITDLFSERFGRYCPIRPVGAHTYELTLPDGKKNYYRYRDGLCREVEVQQPFFTIYFRLRND